ncbi:hypothetical protein A3B33_03185 [Candidatus Adlerbacteria bacterium RIFCSPLOWO2_01_FULL_54_16]|nr:MAG: hypothetical protein A3B33_03185 [Candidatus Adlerbacteria bacterium RIFCSPLOWO2_01_FULL_54_16]
MAISKKVREKVDGLVREHFEKEMQGLHQVLARRSRRPRPLEYRVKDALVEVSLLGKPSPSDR